MANSPEVIFDFADLDFDTPGKRHYQLAFHLDSAWGYSLVPATVIRGAGADGAGVAVIGGTHGNEYEGQIAVRRLCGSLDAKELRGLVILIPQLSESACRAGTRVSPMDGVNMNRAFPGNARGSVSLPNRAFCENCRIPARPCRHRHSLRRSRGRFPTLHFVPQIARCRPVR